LRVGTTEYEIRLIPVTLTDTTVPCCKTITPNCQEVTT